MRDQAVSQYPESFDDHKETPWQAPQGTVIVTMLFPMGPSARSQAKVTTELAISQGTKARPQAMPPQDTETAGTPRSIQIAHKKLSLIHI